MRLTFIRENGDIHQTKRFKLRKLKPYAKVKVPMKEVPDWAGIDTEIIVAENGKVQKSFTVKRTAVDDRVWKQKTDPVLFPIQKRKKYKIFIE